MKWYCVENVGTTDVASLTLLGLSTSRGTDKIGQFGSGSKHAVLTLLRSGLKVEIFCGETSLIPDLETIDTLSGSVQRLCYRVKEPGKRSRIERTSVTLGFGALDWTETEFALREIVSNAIDGSPAGWSGVATYIVSGQPTGCEGRTRVYVQASSEVQRYFGELQKYFLHVDGREGFSLLQKLEPSPMRFYRKGVFVRQSEDKSLFDYNDYAGTLRIDESRILDESTVMSHISDILSEDIDGLKHCLLHLADDLVETRKLSYWRLSGGKLLAAWQSLYGEDCMCCDSVEISRRVRDKGFAVRTVPNSTWFNSLTQSGIVDAACKLGKCEKKGHTVLPATLEAENAVNEVWELLKFFNLVPPGKDKPAVMLFQRSMDADDEQVHGYYEDDVVYLHVDRATDNKVILEELAHHITGARDCDRAFQDFAFRVASLLM